MIIKTDMESAAGGTWLADKTESTDVRIDVRQVKLVKGSRGGRLWQKSNIGAYSQGIQLLRPRKTACCIVSWGTTCILSLTKRVWRNCVGVER